MHGHGGISCVIINILLQIRDLIVFEEYSFGVDWTLAQQLTRKHD